MSARRRPPNDDANLPVVAEHAAATARVAPVEGTLLPRRAPARGFSSDDAAIHGYLLEFAERPNTQRAYAREVLRYARWLREIRGKALADATREDVVAYKGFAKSPPAHWRGRRGSHDGAPFVAGLTPTGLRQMVLILGGFYAYLQRAQHVEHNPFTVARERVPVDTSTLWRMRALKWNLVEQVIALLTEAAEALGDGPARHLVERERFAVAFLSNLGLRRGEFAQATSDDLHYEDDPADGQRYWYLRVTGKGRKTRDVALNADAAAAWRRWQAYLVRNGLNESRGRLLVAFSTSGALARRGCSDNTVYRIVQSAYARAAERLEANDPDAAARLLEATPHRLRHSFATATVDAGARLDIVQKQLGHASIQTTTRYTAVDKLTLAREMNRKKG